MTKFIHKGFDRYRDMIKKNTGHILLEIYSNNKAKYKCGSCGEILEIGLSSLSCKGKSNTCKKCPRIRKDRTKYTINSIREIIENKGMKLIDKKLNNFAYSRTKLNLICKCGEKWQNTLRDIERGRSCKKCKVIKYKETCTERYDTDNTSKSKIVKEYITEKNLFKHGVEYPQQNKEINEKCKSTCMEKFGKEYSFNQDWVYDKIRITHKEKHGVEYPMQSENIRKKCNDTFRKNYGVDWPAQDPEIFSKLTESRYGKKEMVLRSGKIIRYMGYEKKCIEYLQNNDYPGIYRPLMEEEIYFERDIPLINYITPNDGKNHIYYPDLYVDIFSEDVEWQNIKCIIEVKCIYTFNSYPYGNYIKFSTCANLGYFCKVYFFDEKKLVDIWTFLPYMTKPPRSKNFTGFKMDQEICMKNGKICNKVEEINDFSEN